MCVPVDAGCGGGGGGVVVVRFGTFFQVLHKFSTLVVAIY